MASVGHSYYSWQLPKEKIKKNVIIEASIVDDKYAEDIHKFILDVSVFDEKPVSFYAKVNGYYLYQRFEKGQKVRLCVRLSPAHGLQNPFAFDYWRWLVSKNIQATGYIVKCDDNELLIPTTNLSYRIRHRLAQGTPQGEKWLNAILLADRSKLNEADWALLQKTGVAHLFTLSGLHMAVVYMLCLWLSKWLFFTFRRLVRWESGVLLANAPQLLALLFAWGFVSLCGFPLTLVRAAIALSLYVVIVLRNHSMQANQGALLVLAGCLFVFPLSSLGISLYLSFFAVFILLLLIWRFQGPAHTFWQKCLNLVRLQFFLSGFMMLATGSVFQSLHWASFLINLFAIPFVSFVVVPLGCITLLMLMSFPSLGNTLADMLGAMLHQFMMLLDSVPTLSNSIVTFSGVWLALLFLLVVLMIPGIRYRIHGLLFVCLSIGLSLFSLSSSDKWQVKVFDVGQGSSMLIQSGKQAMLVDTGPSYRNRNSAAETIISPFLTAHKLTKNTLGVLTHLDNDHAGGRGFLSDNRIVQRWLSPYEGCVKGAHWKVGKLDVKVLWPSENDVKNNTLSENNLSCVMHITDGNISVLIPGDIEKAAENQLLSSDVDLHADILIAPHHGSKTSSTAPWVNAVSPQYVVFTNGYLNRWGFPHQEVVRRYRNIDSVIYTTAEDGFIQFSMSDTTDDNKKIDVETWFDDMNQRWYKSR
ncbi:DNA internalization-related competence protein ComEC/Rec2 [Alteromonas sp. 5E99-2]|nr:DNA internalization-related competence protein ComEC/Rec2 [Alteromonas sp. 5E99-2]